MKCLLSNLCAQFPVYVSTIENQGFLQWVLRHLFPNMNHVRLFYQTILRRWLWSRIWIGWNPHLQFHNKINVSFGFEYLLERNDVFMFHFSQDFNFTINHFRFVLNRFFVNYFQCKTFSTLLMDASLHNRKCPTNRLTFKK